MRRIKILYIDSNIFIFASTNKGKLGQNCRKIIKLTNEHKISCATSFLVLDEVMWVLKKNIGRESAIKIIKAILSMTIKWIDVDKSIMINTIEIFEKTKIYLICCNIANEVLIYICSKKNASICFLICVELSCIIHFTHWTKHRNYKNESNEQY